VPDRTNTIAAARRLHERGLRLTNQGRPREAEGALKSALVLLGRVDVGADQAVVSARVLNTLGFVEFQLRGLQAAITRLDQADEVVRANDLTAVGLAVQVQRGNLLLRVGRLADAIAVYDAGSSDQGDAPDSDRCSLLLNRAVAHLEMGSVTAARSDLERCRRAAKAAGLDRLELKATHNLGYVEFVAGDLPEALNLMDRAFAMDPTVAPGTALLGKAEVLVEAGLVREADEVLRAAGAIFRRERLTYDLAEAELERARCALATDDASSARRLAATARDRFRRRGSDRWRRSAELVLLQADLAGGHAGARLVGRALRLRDELAAEGLRLPARAAALIVAEAQLASGRRDAATAALSGLGRARRDDPITGRMHSHYVHARVDAAHGRTSVASRRIRRALEELAAYQASFGSIDLRTASAVHGRRLAELDIALALESGRPGAVFAAAERARAVSSRLPAVRPPVDPVAADLLAELRQNIESLRTVEQDRMASESLLRKRRELERQIIARSWTIAGSGPAARSSSMAEVRDRLAERGRSMLMYVQTGARLSAVVLDAQVHVHDLGASAPVIESVRRARADLDVLAHPRLAGGIRAAVRSSLDRSLRGLDAALLQPLTVDGPMVIVSTGVLGQLPWASLPSLRGRSLVVAPSATKWLSSTEVGAGGRPKVVAIAGPDLGRGADEATAVGTAWAGARVVTGAGATTVALADALTSAHVLHVAAHGVHQPENPLFSSVRMVDGPVFAHELDLSARAPEHVVLSACEVGVATIRPGDEALGLASVLLQLGTRSVVAGVARVGDEVAEQTMALYHSKLATGQDSSIALARALAEIDTDVVPPFVNFGAAWSVTG
jgi:tetratricopeptide (TPR) repeat protein